MAVPQFLLAVEEELGKGAIDVAEAEKAELMDLNADASCGG